MEPSQNGETEMLVTVPSEDYSALRELARAEGVEVVELESRNVADPATISLVLIGTSLAVSVVTHLIEQRRGGQVFDLRPDAARPAYRSKDVLYGYVQMIAADGTVTVEVKEPRGMFGQVLDTLRLLIKEEPASDADALADAAHKALGDAAAVQRT